ncbi:hypothetical protein D3C85_1546510 [compost metagenome]
MLDEQGGRRRGNTRQVVVLGDPVAFVTVGFHVSRKSCGFIKRVGEGFSFTDHHEVKHRKGCHCIFRFEGEVCDAAIRYFSGNSDQDGLRTRR